jgi:hypothetical protein
MGERSSVPLLVRGILAARETQNGRDEEGGMTGSGVPFFYVPEIISLRTKLLRYCLQWKAQKTQNKCLIRGVRITSCLLPRASGQPDKGQEGKMCCNLNRIWKPLGGEMCD